ncbi:MAG: acetate/propionate family kinase [Planctomycetota bacterium]|jgi:acetate kinase
MIVLVANLGSTSFKYKLFDLSDPGATGRLAEGAADRIGQGDSAWSVSGAGKEAEGVCDLADHGEAIELHMKRLAEIGVDQINDLGAIGFKAVHGGPISGAVRVDEDVLQTMRDFSDVAPAHNPPYIAAMEAFAAKLPGVPQVAAFETAFHQTMPEARKIYGIPYEWTQMGVRRFGFHGASHRYIATRMAEIAPDAKRTPQSGLFHNNRVGDFDAFAILKLLAAGIDIDTVFQRLGKEGGLLGISGVSADMREVEEAAAGGHERARLAIDAFVESCRHYLGAYLVALGGADAITFTGGIGQHGAAIRRAILAGTEWAGIAIDEAKNAAADPKGETRIEQEGSGVQVWVLPTNEELIVARQAVDVLKAS